METSFCRHGCVLVGIDGYRIEIHEIDVGFGLLFPHFTCLFFSFLSFVPKIQFLLFECLGTKTATTTTEDGRKEKSLALCAHRLID